MQRRTATFLLLAASFAVVVVVSAGWFASDPPAPTRPGAGEPGAGELPAAPARPPAPDPLTGFQPPGPQPPGSEGLRVRVEVRSREVFVPPPAVRVQAVRSLDGGELPTTALAGSGAGFDDSPPRAGLALVAIGVDGAARVLRQVAVAASGVSRPVVGARIVTRGLVMDLQKQPIPGAQVWLGELDSSGDRRCAVTDEQGAFELDTPAGTGVPFVLQAAGYASQWEAVAVAAPSPMFTRMLQPAAPLEVRLATSSLGIEEARLFVVPQGAVSTELAHYPFFLQVLTDGCAFGANGRASVSDLPIRGSLGIVVRHPRTPGGAAHAVELQARNTPAVVPLSRSPDEWQGQVVDENGAALVGVAVWSRPRGGDLGDGASLRLLPPHMSAPGCHFARTNATGVFRIGGIAGDGATLSLRAFGRAGRDLPWPPADPRQPIVLPVWSGGEPAFRLLPPQAAIAWTAESDLAGGVRAAVAADQPWVVSFPHAGRFDLVLTTYAGDVRKGTQTLTDVVVTGTVELQSPRLP